MIELGMFVFFAPFAIGAIVCAGLLAFMVLGLLAALVLGVLEALGRALLALALTPRWLWRAARAGTLYPPTPPPRPRPAQSRAFRFGRWMAARWWRPWLFALGYVAVMAAVIIVHGP
jgi:hypothetical protein